MIVVVKIFVSVTFIVSLSTVSRAKEWRGLKPLHSTRADVERLLGEPPPPPKDGTRVYALNKGRSIYFLDEGEIYIVYAEPEVPAAASCLGRIPAGTVLLIQVTPKPDWTFSELQLDERDFRKFDASQPPNLGYEGYINEQEGLVIRTFKGRVEQISYFASALDKALCPTYYENPEAAVQVMVCGLSFIRKFDEYGKLSSNDEKARLDNIALELQQVPETQLYIIAYAGRKARPGEAQTKADRAKNYLDLERRVGPGRVIALDGGYREELTLEFFIGAAGATPPTASPTVDPSEVIFIYDDEKSPRGVSNPSVDRIKAPKKPR